METAVHTPTRNVNSNRAQLLAGISCEEHTMDLAGLSSAVLEAGEGAPVVLLHGPFETAPWWMRVIPKLAKTHRVIVPDLPGHGESRAGADQLQGDFVLDWLSDLIRKTCVEPPVLVGHILGGSIAARFAAKRGGEIRHLVLVDSLGLAKFRPSPLFAFNLVRFIMRPTEKNYNKFMPHCMYDVDELAQKMGTFWEPFVEYNLEVAQDPVLQEALQYLMKEWGIPKIPDETLRQIKVPVSLIWGRYDKANKLSKARVVSKRFGWPLQVIDDTRDDPKLERPEEFVRALLNAVEVQA